MDEKALIDEVVRELKLKLEKKLDRNVISPSKLKRASVLGNLKEEEWKVVKCVYTTVPFEDAESCDVLILGQLSLKLLSELALGIPADSESRIILRALLCGKEVYLLEDGIEYRNYKETAVKTLYHLYQEYEDRLIKHGLKFIRYAADLREHAEGISLLPVMDSIDFSKQSLLRESDLMKARNKGFATILLAQDAIITPLARDYIANHNLSVRRVAKR